MTLFERDTGQCLVAETGFQLVQQLVAALQVAALAEQVVVEGVLLQRAQLITGEVQGLHRLFELESFQL